MVLELGQDAVKVAVAFDEVFPLLDAHVVVAALGLGVNLNMERRILVYLPSLHKLIRIENPDESLNSLVSWLIVNRQLGNLYPHFIKFLFEASFFYVFNSLLTLLIENLFF